MFFLCSYKYERYSPVSNSTLSISPCLLDSNNSLPIPVAEKSQSKIDSGKMIIFYLSLQVLFKVSIDDLAYGIWLLLSKALLLKLRYYSAIKKIIEYKAEAPILWPPDVKSQLIGKDPDAKEKLRAGERWLDGTINSMDMSLSKPWEIVKAREDWYAAIHSIAKT